MTARLHVSGSSDDQSVPDSSSFTPDILVTPSVGVTPSPAVAAPAATATTTIGGAVDTGEAPAFLVVQSAQGTGSGSSSAGGAGSGSSASVTSVTTAGSGLIINISWDASVASAPAAFKTAIMSAASTLEGLFTNAVSVNISVGWGEVGGYSMASNALGESMSYLTQVSYASLANAYRTDATSATQVAAASSLAASSPISGANYFLSTADAKALGLYAGSGTDGFVGFAANQAYSYTDTSGVASGTYDLTAIALHEITEVMGRQMLSGGTIGFTTHSYDLLDMFHYAATGTLAGGAMGGYLSANGGVTDLGNFNATSGGDVGDWASSMGNDALDAFSHSGVVNAFSSADTTIMNMLGWNLAGQLSAKAPTGIALATTTTGLAANLTASGIASGTRLGTLSEVGGTSTDSYSFTLGGAGVGKFALTASGNSAVLSAGFGGVAGSATGTLYALTLTANDTTNATSSPTSALDVVIANGAGATISLATVLGSANIANASFIYGLGAGETINAAGTTGTAFVVVGGAGDRITAGSGVMDVIFSSTSQSTAAAMDVISSFASNDLLDFSGISTALRLAGAVGSSLSANSIGYQLSGGNTFVYVNSSSGTETLASANMKIEILGSHALSSSNTIV